MKKKKLYYLPGIISIMGLPVLLFFWGPPDPVHQNTISMVLPAANHSCCTPLTEAMVYQEIKHKKLVTLNLNDLVWNDQSAWRFQRKFSFAAQQIESMQFTNDTASVLKISFGQKNKYSDVLWVINQAMVYDLRRYALIGNDLYLFPSPPVKPLYATIDLPALQTPRGWSGVQAKWKQLQYQFNYLFQRQQQNKWLVAGFLLLIVVPATIKIRQYALACMVDPLRDVQTA